MFFFNLVVCVFYGKDKNLSFRIAKTVRRLSCLLDCIKSVYVLKMHTRHGATMIMSIVALLLNYLQIYTNSNPGMIVLGVTPGYALKLKHRIPNKGTFINPGSAGEFVCHLVFRPSLNMSKYKLSLVPYKIAPT